MTISIANHRLVDVPFNESPNHGAAFATGLPDALIIHFTAGGSAQSSVNWLCNPQAKASAHVVVGRDGAITQLVAFDTIAWHAGASSYGERSGYNRYSIGIELDNPGRLSRTAAGGFVSYLGTTYPAEQVIHAVHRNEQTATDWLAYTEAQLATAFELCTVLCHTYLIREILGHEEIAPGRKVDPGPAFPLDKLRQLLIVRGRDADEPSPALTSPPTPAATITAIPAASARGYVLANKLNFRALPRVDATKIAAPLTSGTLVDVLDQQSGWYQVRSNNNVGWVKAEYIKTATGP
ncbi:MAG: N-acetylmuramyl-L-alanine amidase, negative regulator of AmpC, AmpD [Verrucomicrobiaceae bacterium]|nr:N-acetylmuramyl-L-alanine amidase, negative regulator of AmpC, AmpD [Verrucomicrobiaceae bacterium]